MGEAANQCNPPHPPTSPSIYVSRIFFFTALFPYLLTMSEASQTGNAQFNCDKTSKKQSKHHGVIEGGAM